MKQIILLLCVLLLSFALYAEDGIVVGFSQVTTASSWYEAETKSLINEATIRGITLLVSDAEYKQEKQIQAIREFIFQKVNAIILNPAVELGWDIVLSEAKDAEIPVFILDRRIIVADESLYVTSFSLDFYGEGQEAAQWLVKKLDYSGIIAQIEGDPTSVAAQERKKGFEDVIAKHPAIKIFISQTGNWTRREAKKILEEWLTAGIVSEIDAVYAHNDNMALGVINALQQTDFKPGEDIIIVSIDGFRAAFEAMLRGELNCTVECSPLFGPLVFDAVEIILAGNSTIPKVIKQRIRVFPQDTAYRELFNRKY